MAKVTIILEDTVNDDGQKVLTVKPEFHEDFDENSVAQAYAEAIIEMIILNSKNQDEVEAALESAAQSDKH